MIVDVHTHIFPPRFIEQRAALAVWDTGFGELYANPKARMATADQLLTSMAAAGVDVSVACGFWWRDPALAAEHAAYLVEAARASAGRLVPFVPGLDPPAGAAGLGEARVATAEDASTLASRATARDLPLLAHCSEEPGHEYPGKHGGLTPTALWHLLRDHPGVRVIAAHWGGGFPFYALMPEVRTALEAGRVLFDTAASPLLYEPRIFRVVADLVGSDLIAWGSDFPLGNQQADLAAVEAAVPDLEERAAILGGNATRFLGLTPPDPTP
ncbi:MAG: amidohydrolase [Dehalococcoidia bacterium]|nr:amidohydrolase [Dehalococcoidia bacterium]